jgi:signal transduction histidine kinase
MPSNQADQMCLAGLTVLYVEREPRTQRLVSRFLHGRVRRFCLAENGASGLERFRSERPDLLVSDLIGPEADSLALIEVIRAEAPEVPVILTTACEQPQVIIRALELGVRRFLLKPLSAVRFGAALLDCAQELRMAREGAARQQQKLALLQAQHEETLGVLASGLAHDYNNLLQGLMTYVAIAKHSRNRPDLLLQLLDSAEAAWEEIRELGNRLGLLHQQERAPFHYVNNLATFTRDALDDSLGASVCALEVVLPDELPRVSFNRQQMKAVLSILARNAVEAMGGSGTLRVEGQARRISPEEPLPVAPGDYLQLSFSDQGPGIAPAILPVMFSPYTSTKARGKQRGMGLSLALAQAIVKLHGGVLLGENRTGGGATLHLLLPVPRPQESLAASKPLQEIEASAQVS